MDDKNEFGTYLVQLKAEQNISMDSLCRDTWYLKAYQRKLRDGILQ